MIRYSDGNLFSAGCQAIVNPVNCVGVMGKGLARAVHRRFPAACHAYFEACQRSWLLPGQMIIGTVADPEPGSPEFIFHVATKLHWARPSRLDWIDKGLDTLASVAATMRIRSVAVPALGCGLGRLEWTDVRPRIEAYLGEHDDIEWVVYPPQSGL
jgi:O-acetyl-ADP-ribose deacetylase (regulator of RNase III)